MYQYINQNHTEFKIDFYLSIEVKGKKNMTSHSTPSKDIYIDIDIGMYQRVINHRSIYFMHPPPQSITYRQAGDRSTGHRVVGDISNAHRVARPSPDIIWPPLPLVFRLRMSRSVIRTGDLWRQPGELGGCQYISGGINARGRLQFTCA